MVFVPPLIAPSAPSVRPLTDAIPSHPGAVMPFASVLLASEMGLDFDPEQALATALGHETDPELIEDSSDASQSENTKVARPDSPDGSMSPTGVQTESQVEHPPVPFAGFADTGMMSQIDANLGSDADIVEVRTLGDHPPTITANRPVGHMMDASLTDRRLVSQSAFPVSAGSTGPLQTRPERPPAQMLHLTRSAPEATVSAAISDPSEGAPAPTKPVQQPTKVQISQSLVPFVPWRTGRFPTRGPVPWMCRVPVPVMRYCPRLWLRPRVDRMGPRKLAKDRQPQPLVRPPRSPQLPCPHNPIS